MLANVAVKFERNRNMGRLFLCNLNIFIILCEGEEVEKCEENGAIFGNKYLKKCSSDFLQF